ncbi:dihydrofolate reductase [Streptococcus loxodontisalivarius]|uniref:Dihydrofolate reductase n=1 Tax=Streptococcus loxodontisalivarius TaxID=1349415 RepID=A0ABS2PT57_9STRE|nr:dihydrofolate reductase [Streptococcus loxodontisalivarius]MBM7643118.1 dihydrofolate reductase [Streptococcus loxodontisalivarius]
MVQEKDKKMIAIWAEDESGLIGVDGVMPWHLPKELKHFKETTTGHAILMGRVTFDGMKRRLLPNRQTLILTRDESYQVEGVETFASVDAVLDWYDKQDSNLYIVGGAGVYNSFAPYFDQVIKTVVHETFKGDTYAPDNVDWSAYDLDSQVFYEKDDKNPYDFTVFTYTKK